MNDIAKKLVVFDFDGTLVRFPKEHLFSTAAKVFKKLGITPLSPEQMQENFSNFDFFGFLDEELKSSCAQELALELERIGHPTLEPFEDTFEVLERLRQRQYRLAIATARVLPVEKFQQSLHSIGLDAYFDVITTRSPKNKDWTDKKPQIDEIAKKLFLATNEMNFVGDIPADVESARDAGIKNIYALSTGGIKPEVLKRSNPTKVLSCLSELLKLLP